MIEKCLEWNLSICIISLDLVKAFDSLSLIAIVKYLQDMPVPLPIQLRYAWFQELVEQRLLDFSFDGLITEPVIMEKGIRQGACDSSLLFALVISHILSSLDQSWRRRGFGVTFGKFGGSDLAVSEFFDAHVGHFMEIDIQNMIVCAVAFIDDLYLICSNPAHAQIMLNELVHELERAGLSLNAQKCSWMCDKQSWEVWGNWLLDFGNGVLKTPCQGTESPW